jgi:hypothetical protein
MNVEILDQLGNFLSSLTGLGPAESVIIIGITLALIPPFKKGVLDNRVEDIIESLSYSRTILIVSTLLAYYYIFQQGFATELILTVGGIVLGITMNQWVTKLTDF